MLPTLPWSHPWREQLSLFPWHPLSLSLLLPHPMPAYAEQKEGKGASCITAGIVCLALQQHVLCFRPYLLGKDDDEANKWTRENRRVGGGRTLPIAFSGRMRRCGGPIVVCDTQDTFSRDKYPSRFTREEARARPGSVNL